MYCKISHAFCLDGESPDYLQYVKVPVMTNTDCNSVYSQLNFITSNMACAGYPEGGKDACQGNCRQYWFENNQKLNLSKELNVKDYEYHYR